MYILIFVFAFENSLSTPVNKGTPADKTKTKAKISMYELSLIYPSPYPNNNLTCRSTAFNATQKVRVWVNKHFINSLPLRYVVSLRTSPKRDLRQRRTFRTLSPSKSYASRPHHRDLRLPASISEAYSSLHPLARKPIFFALFIKNYKKSFPNPCTIQKKVVTLQPN